MIIIEFNKQTVIIGFCYLLTLLCTVVFLTGKSDSEKQEIVELVNNTKPVAAESVEEMSSSSGAYKPIDLATFSWSEQEQEAVFQEVAYAYQNIIKNISIDYWDSNYYESLKRYRPPDISFTRGEVPIIGQLRESPYHYNAQRVDK